MRKWQSIQAARSGLHVTPFGSEYEVSHEFTRSYCIPVPPDRVKWEPESGRGDGWHVPHAFQQEQTLAIRQLLADDQHSYRVKSAAEFFKSFNQRR